LPRKIRRGGAHREGEEDGSAWTKFDEELTTLAAELGQEDKRGGGLGGSCGVLGEGKGRHEGKNSTKGALAAF
jgi:hypothetical protein